MAPVGSPGASSPAAIDPYSDTVTRLLQGAVDLHCHSGPSVMPRALDHLEAVQDAAKHGFRAVLIKDHYYVGTPMANLLNRHFADLKVSVLSGVPLNNPSGGFNVYAVDHGLKLGAKLVWMPTFSARNHLAGAHRTDFPKPRMSMLAPAPLTALDERGALREEVKPILDLIAEHDVVLSGGHLSIAEIFAVFEEAKRRGVQRLLVNHPTFLIGASHADIRRLVEMGAYIEHSISMFVPGSKGRIYEPKDLKELIEAGTVERTILGSDLGQAGNCLPSVGFREVICICLELGYREADIRRMINDNPAKLIGLNA
jgi:hypothetical protein